jgi:hypothetical protein
MLWSDGRLQVATAITATALAVGGITYYVLVNHQKTTAFNQAKRQQRKLLHTLAHIEKDLVPIQDKIANIEKDTSSTEFRVRECNELLLRLLESLDAIKVSDIQQNENVTPREQIMIDKVKNRKRGIIQKAQKEFHRLDSKVVSN